MDFKFWERKPVPDKLPEPLDQIRSRVKQAPGQQAALKLAHELLSQRYHGLRGQTYVRIKQLFRDSASVLESQPGFLHCTHVNYLLTAILEKSGWFKPEDIRYRWTLVFGFSPHQFTEVRVGSDWIPVDIWGAAYGIELGDYSRWFHAGRLW